MSTTPFVKLNDVIESSGYLYGMIGDVLQV